jgi:kojibiose phosphorylase
MRNIYSNYVNDELWLIRENEWVEDLQNIRESQFTLGNGYIGSRGIYEELPRGCIPGTYLSGLYDHMASQVAELVNLPNPVNFKFTIKGEKFSVMAMDLISHKRVLNTKKAVLARQTMYKDSKGRRYDYQSVRFISQHNKNIGVMQISLTALDASCIVDINTGIDTSVSNAGTLSGEKEKHFRIKELGQYRQAGYLVADTFEKKHTIIYWSGFYYTINGKKTIAEDNIFRLKLKKNQPVIFTKVFYIKHFPHKNNYKAHKNDTFKEFYQVLKTDFSILIKEHIKAWEKLWQRADIIIGGTANIQNNMRFNIYHMLICAHYDNGLSSIGARTLSGEGYRGHIFWDAEIFLLPFYLFTFPKVAKNMLIYRYRRLEASRKIAKANGYSGAQFAWESSGDGVEETPEWARDFDRTIVKIYTHKMEHHITADIAYAVYKYYLSTGDEEFMKDYGYELLIETARFWNSRLSYNKTTKRYDIDHIIGPDEIHIDVKNNAFTNLMARWNLITAANAIDKLSKTSRIYKVLKDKLNFKEREAQKWKQVASRIELKINNKKIIEQFEGYFKLKNIVLKKTDENGIPLLADSLRTKDLEKTQLVKQADVLMAIFLLSDQFNKKIESSNYDFYITRTLHKSSLSAPIHAIMAARSYDLQRAYNFFNVALRTDISNIYGNTDEGIHAASLGGTWQAVVFGFGGVRFKKEDLCIYPNMPRTWKDLAFSLTWQENLIKLDLSNEAVKIKITSHKHKKIRIEIFGKPLTLSTNKSYEFKRDTDNIKKEGYYCL